MNICLSVIINKAADFIGKLTLITRYKKITCYLMFGFLPVIAMAEGQGLIFADFIAINRTNDDINSNVDNNDFIPRVALFYANDFGNTRVLGEYIIDDEEKRFGRLKFAWEPDNSNILWIGRTHNPSSYWRDQFHHGGWLQPTINRPGIADFEFSGGILPVISTGIILEGGSSINNLGGLAYVVNLGITSVLGKAGLESPNLSETDLDIHDSSFSIRLSYKFDSINGGDEIGVFGSNNHIANSMNANDEFEQQVIGFFMNWWLDDLRFISEIYTVTNTTVSAITVSNKPTQNFQNGYAMFDYALNDNWNIYTRFENSAEEKNNQYLSNFSNFVIKRSLFGLRYNINRNQTLKFEIEKNEKFSGLKHNLLTAQWSFVYP